MKWNTPGQIAFRICIGLGSLIFIGMSLIAIWLCSNCDQSNVTSTMKFIGWVIGIFVLGEVTLDICVYIMTREGKAGG